MVNKMFTKDGHSIAIIHKQEERHIYSGIVYDHLERKFIEADWAEDGKILNFENSGLDLDFDHENC